MLLAVRYLTVSTAVFDHKTTFFDRYLKKLIEVEEARKKLMELRESNNSTSKVSHIDTVSSSKGPPSSISANTTGMSMPSPMNSTTTTNFTSQSNQQPIKQEKWSTIINGKSFTDNNNRESAVLIIKGEISLTTLKENKANGKDYSEENIEKCFDELVHAIHSQRGALSALQTTDKFNVEVRVIDDEPNNKIKFEATYRPILPPDLKLDFLKDLTAEDCKATGVEEDVNEELKYLEAEMRDRLLENFQYAVHHNKKEQLFANLDTKQKLTNHITYSIPDTNSLTTFQGAFILGLDPATFSKDEHLLKYNIMKDLVSQVYEDTITPMSSIGNKKLLALLEDSGNVKLMEALGISQLKTSKKRSSNRGGGSRGRPTGRGQGRSQGRGRGSETTNLKEAEAMTIVYGSTSDSKDLFNEFITAAGDKTYFVGGNQPVRFSLITTRNNLDQRIRDCESETKKMNNKGHHNIRLHSISKSYIRNPRASYLLTENINNLKAAFPCRLGLQAGLQLYLTFDKAMSVKLTSPEEYKQQIMKLLNLPNVNEDGVDVYDLQSEEVEEEGDQSLKSLVKEGKINSHSKEKMYVLVWGIGGSAAAGIYMDSEYNVGREGSIKHLTFKVAHAHHKEVKDEREALDYLNDFYGGIEVVEDITKLRMNTPLSATNESVELLKNQNHLFQGRGKTSRRKDKAYVGKYTAGSTDFVFLHRLARESSNSRQSYVKERQHLTQIAEEIMGHIETFQLSDSSDAIADRDIRFEWVNNIIAPYGLTMDNQKYDDEYVNEEVKDDDYTQYSNGSESQSVHVNESSTNESDKDVEMKTTMSGNKREMSPVEHTDTDTNNNINLNNNIQLPANLMGTPPIRNITDITLGIGVRVPPYETPEGFAAWMNEQLGPYWTDNVNSITPAHIPSDNDPRELPNAMVLVFKDLESMKSAYQYLPTKLYAGQLAEVTIIDPPDIESIQWYSANENIQKWYNHPLVTCARQMCHPSKKLDLYNFLITWDGTASTLIPLLGTLEGSAVAARGGVHY